MEEAIEDTEWLDPDRLYLALGTQCEDTRPFYQGDVLTGVPLPRLPRHPVKPGAREIEFQAGSCMLLPHPCQCYNGDQLRKKLAVAPVESVGNYDNFGEKRDRAYDKIALPGLPAPLRDSVAKFGELISLPKEWILAGQRVACLSHEGLGLLAKRIIRFQLRNPTTLTRGMAFTQAEWAESFIMQAWIRRHGSLAGYSEWLRTPIVIPGVGKGEKLAPYAVRAGATEVLIQLIGGSNVTEKGPVLVGEK